MQHYDVIVVGGGPAGSTCARELVSRGAHVAVIDAAVFPRDKVCAGWITPQVMRDVALDVQHYARGRTFQPLTGFRVGTIGAARAVPVRFDAAVSAAIRRCEFDAYLLELSRADRHCGTAVRKIERRGRQWVVNGGWTAPMLVGAAGWGCPVGRMLNGAAAGGGPLIVAKEAEYVMPARACDACVVANATAEIYFTSDLLGYGWCVRKGDVLNVGLGRLGRRLARPEVEAFAAFAGARGVAPPAIETWRGHAYVAGAPQTIRRTGDGILLVGDAAGLANPKTGEGIGPAVESALVAARTIAAAGADVGVDRLSSYDAFVARRWQQWSPVEAAAGAIPSIVLRPIVGSLLRTRAFVQNVIVNRWFLHAYEDPSYRAA
jgi:flavin-dependent dehydrogenase